MKYSLIMDKVSVDKTSDIIRSNPMQEVSRAEAEYRGKIAQVCDQAIRDGIYILLITGPSASGKTTSAKMIADELTARGQKVNRISLDNFYKNVEELPRWSDGYQNYEAVEGLDISCFEEMVQRLLREGHANFPIFDFTTGRRAAETINLTCDPHTFLIIEGIHALNPLIFKSVEGFSCMKIYISVHSDFVDGQGNILLCARDLRLIRRVIRDFYYRSTLAEDTFKMWDYVLRGEDLYIRPFRKYADLHINSTPNYEPYLYHDEMVRMLLACTPDSPYTPIIQRMMAASSHFFHMASELVPDSSLIQEFLKPKSWK